MEKTLFNANGNIESKTHVIITRCFDEFYSCGSFLKALKYLVHKIGYELQGGVGCDFGDMNDYDEWMQFEGVKFVYGYNAYDDPDSFVIVSEEVCYKYVRLAAEKYIALHPKDTYKVNTLLALMPYSQGYGIQEEYRKALENYKYDIACFQKAANKNIPEAQNDLGVMYAKSYGIEQDFQKAFDLFQKAADKNIPEAQYNLGVMYEKGHGVEKDIQKAIEYYQKAADQNYPEAQNNLGFIYEKGHGVEKDIQKAKEYYQKAADQDILEASFSLSLIYSDPRVYFGDKDIARKYDEKQKEYSAKFNKQNFLFDLYGDYLLIKTVHGISKDYQKTKKY